MVHATPGGSDCWRMTHDPSRGENVVMHDRERGRELRAAVFTANGEELVSLLQSGPWPGHALQLIGDGLLAALSQGVTGARDLALDCVTELRERDWDGDEELATALIARLGAGPAPMLRPLPVDLDQLADVLEGDPAFGGGRIDLRTGEVWPQSFFDDGIETGEEDEEDDDDRWLWVFNEGSRAGYRDMERFVAGIEANEIAAQLTRALDGRGAFRRFRNQLTHWPGLHDSWNAYSAERRRGRARAWLATEGYTPMPAARDNGSMNAT
jgi:hypothetical protein